MDKTEIVNDVLLRLGSCCEPWARARRGGTDNEGYGTLIDADYEIGNGLPP